MILLLDVIQDRDVLWGNPHFHFIRLYKTKVSSNPNYLFVVIKVEAGQKNIISVSLEATAPYPKKVLLRNIVRTCVEQTTYSDLAGLFTYNNH